MDNWPETIDGLEFGDFRHLYRQLVARTGKSQEAIAKEIGYENGGFLSLVLNQDGRVPPDRIKDWLAPLDLSDAEFALMYRKGLEQYAPPYVQELVANFARAYRHIQDGHTLPSLESILVGRIPKKRKKP